MTSQRGFAAPILLVVIALVVVSIGGIAVDLWRVLEAQRRLSGHVDAAATAAAASADVDGFRVDPNGAVLIDAAEAIAQACQILTNALDVQQCPGPQVQIDVEADVVSIVVHQQIELAIVGRLGFGAEPSGLFEVAASAVAQLERGIGPAPP